MRSSCVCGPSTGRTTAGGAGFSTILTTGPGAAVADIEPPGLAGAVAVADSAAEAGNGLPPLSERQSTSITVSPTTTCDSGFNRSFSTGTPSTSVPLVLFKSSIQHSSPCIFKRACLREIVESLPRSRSGAVSGLNRPINTSVRSMFRTDFSP